MKRVLACLFLPLALGACDPFPKDDDEIAAKNATPKPAATPKPTPAPGAWMYEKRDNPLDKKANH